jgi:hypothetical protein
MIGIARRIARAIDARLDARTFLPLLAVALITTWYGLGPSLDRIVELTGRRFVDMQPGITPFELVAQLAAYSPTTVGYYVAWLVFDLAWPFVTYTTMLFMAAWLLRRAGGAWSQRLWWFVAIAYTTVAMDWAENIGFGLLVTTPGQPRLVAELAVLAHRAKLAFNFLFNCLFLVGLVAAGAAITRRSRR